MAPKSIPYWLGDTLGYACKNINTDAVDVVIIGGGLRGLSVLFWLLPHKMKTVIIDRGTVPYRSSVRNLGCVNTVPDGKLSSYPKDQLKERIRIATDNNRWLKNFLQYLKVPCNTIKSGSLHVSMNNSHEQQLDYNAKLLGDIGLGSERLTQKEIFNLNGCANFQSGLFYPQDFSINPYLLTKFLSTTCLSRIGNYSLYDTNVLLVDEVEDGVVVSTDNGNFLKAKFVVFANNESYIRSVITDGGNLQQYKQSINNIKRIYNLSTMQLPELSKMANVACRTVSGSHAWHYRDQRLLYSLRRASTAGHKIDYMKFNNQDVKRASEFILKHFPGIAMNLAQDYVWEDFYVDNGSLLPDVGLRQDSERIILNVGYGYDWMDLFFAYGKYIASFISEGVPIPKKGAGDEEADSTSA